ncbi:flagellar motor protein MotB, partial [Bacillus sp. HC-Mk]
MSKGPQKGSPRWMTTFTDLTMLLLTFFVLLVATSKQDAVKLSKMLEKFSDTGQVDAKVMENTIP